MDKKQYITLGVMVLVLGGFLLFSKNGKDVDSLDKTVDETGEESAKDLQNAGAKSPSGGTPAKSGPVVAKEISATVVVKDLNIPWELAFLPDGELLITERAGNLVRVKRDGSRISIPIPQVTAVGEGGLLGLALHPNFLSNNFFYVYKTTGQGSDMENVVMRYRLNDIFISEETMIVDNIPASSNHNGGRIAFGPTEACKAVRSDCLLYITTGDAGTEANAQNPESLAGKILRVKDEGSIPSDNPFGNRIWSYGHRNPQGMAWDSDYRMWALEHGRSGLFSGLDELNLIVAGKNYGWPVIQGSADKIDMETPIIHSGAETTWAPAGATMFGKSIFFGGLRGEALYEAVLNGSKVSELKEHLKGKYGRIRIVQLGPDGMLYIGTSNKDGRGKPNTDDDKIIKIDPKSLR